mgnify:FL=1|jgi:predicted transcriptional regulator
MVQYLELLKGHSVEEAMMLNITTFSPEDSIDLVVNKLISSTENSFVIVKNNIIKGLLYHQDIIDNSNKNILVKDIMNTNFKTVNSTDNLDDIYKLTYSNKHPFFPVLENTKLVGAIDSVNLNEYLLLQAKLAY